LLREAARRDNGIAQSQRMNARYGPKLPEAPSAGHLEAGYVAGWKRALAAFQHNDELLSSRLVLGWVGQ